MHKVFRFIAITAFSVACAPPQRPVPPARTVEPTAPSSFDMFAQQRLFKRLIDLSFMTQLGDEMIVRKIEYRGADNMTIPAYFFAPRDTTRKYPGVIVVHGGVHGDFSDLYVTHVRSLINEGYVVVAPEYRGSTGYGKAHYDAIDYGGKEVEDAIAARDWLAEFVPNADITRMAMLGWSHGGFITLHAIFRRPELFKVAVAHVPVADLPTRIRTHSAAYHKIFSDQPGFGGTLDERPQAYIDRSPIAHVRKLKTPVLVHAASNDDDVFIIENHNLRDSMIAAGKDREGLYTYREWKDPPGGHSFSRVDTKEGRESWRESLAFLRKYLKPDQQRTRRK
ncbi:MAG TPA: alpha/beta fold hydrolase [Gemmatimonadaceae bacterium]|nr:alpha/beta fold hydrolase [Gemmatimonadaceae bacterium]